MALMNCPACGLQISTQAVACPGCGHPNKLYPVAALDAPNCYACPRQATTRCQSCGTLSCALHLESIGLGRQGYELRCKDCVESAHFWWVVSLIVVAVMILFAFIYTVSNKPRTTYPSFQPEPTTQEDRERMAKELLEKYFPGLDEMLKFEPEAEPEPPSGQTGK